MSSIQKTIVAFAVAICSTMPLVVLADAPVADSTTGESTVRPTIGRLVDSSRLGKLRGGLDTSNKNSVDGSVRDNSASHITTGANIIADGSFAHAVGLPTVIQNSGANVLIQNSTIVNVQLR